MEKSSNNEQIAQWLQRQLGSHKSPSIHRLQNRAISLAWFGGRNRWCNVVMQTNVVIDKRELRVNWQLGHGVRKSVYSIGSDAVNPVAPDAIRLLDEILTQIASAG